jgi:antitoxin VapB
MALNLKNREVEELATEVSRMAGETKTEAIRRSLVERKARLQAAGVGKSRKESLLEFLEREVWPNLPPGERGRRLTREEEDEILGYGPEGF